MAVILSVDDNVELTENMADFLADEGHEVLTAHSGEAAYNILGEREFDLLILDWELPDTTGPEICKNYRDRGGMGCVLLLTGRSAAEDKVAGLKAGADDYLTKPFNIPEFGARIEALLRRSLMSKKIIEPLVFDESMVGKVFGGRYAIEAVLGKGGMGIVYKGTHTLIKRTVAIKVLSGKNIGTGTRKRFEREAKAMSLLKDHNLISIFDFGMANQDVPYIVMEYVEGATLAAVLKERGRLTVKDSLEIFLQICDGLGHAHSQSIIHRDLKPANIIITQDKVAKVLDLGVAKFSDDLETASTELTWDGEIFGSPLYMSPEQGTNGELDLRTDIYSMGCVMYETLTGEVPLKGYSFVETMNKRMNTRPPSLSEQCPGVYFPSELNKIVRQAISPKREERQSTMYELREQLMPLLADPKVQRGDVPVSATAAKKETGLFSIVRNLLGKKDSE